MNDVLFHMPSIYVYLALGCASSLVVWVLIRRRRRKVQAPRGGGMAAALALDEDLAGARSIFEERVRQSGYDFVDSVIGLVAVMRAQGELQRAKTLIESLSARRPALWLDCIRLRLRMDSGDASGAVDLVRKNQKIPSDLAVAALLRAGHALEALDAYRSRTPRRKRESCVEADLVALVALQALKEGDEKRARKHAGKAKKLNRGARLPLFVLGVLDSPDENGPVSAPEWPWQIQKDAETFKIVQSSHTVREADRLYCQGDLEGALGVLRARLDEDPTDWCVRQRYAEGILDQDDPRLWRTELKEITELLKNEPRVSIKGYCQACGFASAEPLIVCPRCDAIGFTSTKRPENQAEPRYLEQAYGADLRMFLAKDD